ncbi:MAG TPA: PDZ domain-containing protein, partial [Polyangiaceae bacterium]|nr:PDZ domain-containing protein [Polyangiaceae bacterium]
TATLAKLETDQSAPVRDPEALDRELDLALLKVDAPQPLPAVKLGDSDSLLVGEHVLAVGNPFGLGHTVTLGIVSAKARTIGAGPYDDFIQTDASINPGNSGGPLFNLRGEVVGINTAIKAGADGIGFAIPSTELRNVLPQLRAKGFVERGRLGLRFQPVDGTLAKALGLDRPHGALVAEIEKGSPAEAAGLREGDVIVEVEGERVRRAEMLPRLVAHHGPGARIHVTVVRQGKRLTLTATLAKLETDQSAPVRDPEALDREPEELLGMTLRNTPDGVTVMGVSQHRGLRVGDVIVEVDGKAIRTVKELREAIPAKGKKAILLRVRRGERELFVGIER